MTEQQTAVQPPASGAPPAPPAPPQAGAAATGTPNAPQMIYRLEDLLGRPATRADVRAIENRATQLSRQLTSAQGRRDEAAKELSNTTDPVIRAGLEQRLKTLDERLVQLEQDIAANGKLRAAAQNLSTTTEEQTAMHGPIPGISSGQFVALSIVFMIFVLAPIATAFARRMWNKPPKAPADPQLAAQSQRIERIEHAIDAVAIEVERISEGQRFVTQLLAKQAEALPAQTEREVLRS